MSVNRESNKQPKGVRNQKASSTFEDLEVYQVAREFRKAMYRVAKQLPESEKFGLASQIRRAAVSLTNKHCRRTWALSLLGTDQVHAALSRLSGGIDR